MKRRLTMLLVAALALLIFAPTIVLRTPLRHRVLMRLAPPGANAVTATTVTAGWLTPISATGVTLTDKSGNLMASVERLTIDRTITGLLTNGSDSGTIRFENPTVYALVHPGGSNIEEALRKPPSATPSGHTPATTSVPSAASYRLEVTGGRVFSRDAATGATWLAESIAASVDQHPGRPLRVEASGLVRPATVDAGGAWRAQSDSPSGRFEFRWGGEEGGQLDGVRVVCQHLPLVALEPWLQRYDSQLKIVGRLTGELAVAYPVAKYDSLSGDTGGRVALSGFGITGAALDGERLTVDETSLAWKCSASGGKVSVENVSFASDVAIFDLRGTLDERTVRSATAGATTPLALATAGELEAEGRVNLARLAQILPQLLQIREGTNITSGQMRFNARSVPQSGGHQLTASITTTPLAGTSGGRAIEWDTPLEINLVAHRSDRHLRFDRLACQSEFLQVNGSGDIRQMEVTGRVDLDELTSRLDQFVDLTDWQLAGRGELTASYQRDQSGQLTANGTGTLNDFVIAYRGDQIAEEPQLEWGIELAGAAPPEAIWPSQLNSATLDLTAADGELALRLMQPTPIRSTWSSTDWPVKIDVAGQLDGWARRLRPWADLSGWKMAGRVELAARGRFQGHPLGVSIAESNLAIDALRAATDHWQLDEPRVEWTGDLGWDSTTSTLTSQTGQLVSSSVAASFRDWFWTADPGQTGKVGGLAAVRVDLGRLAKAKRRPADDPPRISPIGEMSGSVKLAAQGGQVVAAVDLSGANVKLQKPAPALPGASPTLKTVWEDPKVRVVGTVSYAPESDQLVFDGLQTHSSTLALAASGSVDRLSTDSLLKLSGTVDYDLTSLTPILAQYIGEGFTIAGREQARFEVKGSLIDVASEETLAGHASNPALALAEVGVPPALQVSSVSAQPAGPSSWYARLLAPWQSASLYGLPIGPGRIAAELTRGRISIEPLDFAVGGGRFTASPSIQLWPEPGGVTLRPGPLLTNVRITPDVSERMLKYITPILAGTTQTEGAFSINLSGATIPIGAPKQADVAGQLAVQSIQVVPGESVTELIGLVREIESLTRARDLASLGQGQPITLLSMSDRTIDFRLVDGRVYHQGLEFQVGELLVRSRGSVGLDETLSLMLEFHVPDKWLGRRARATGAGRTVLEVPVTGTLSRWKPDRRAVLDAVKQRGLEAAGQLLGDEIGNAIDKLIGGER